MGSFTHSYGAHKRRFTFKKIEQFLHAYNFEKDYTVVQKRLNALLRYIDHALDVYEQEPTMTMQYDY
ncbi:hypothetical protein LR68_04254 [Anoxybacillus sp. BCO1]|nr:hypothetical protein LR68_04254 [Anoxybacillus sp. BCO1]